MTVPYRQIREVTVGPFAGPERVRFAEVVVGVDDPDALAAALRERVDAAATAAAPRP